MTNIRTAAFAAAIALLNTQAYAQTVETEAAPPVDETVDEADVSAPEAEPGAEEAVVPTRGERAAPRPGAISLGVGLGLSNFRGELNNNLGAGPSWEVRAGIADNSPVSAEIAYTGTWHGVDDEDADLGPGVDGTAMASMGDALVRFNATTKESWQPFAAVGLGVLGLDVRDADTTVDRGTALTVPVSAGVNVFTGRRMIVGARLNYRLLTDVIDNDIPSGDQWSAGVNLGATF